MSKGTKVKKVKIPLSGKDEGISDMFNQMLGAGNVNLSISYPKYMRIKSLCINMVKLMRMVSESPYMKNSITFAEQRKEIDDFCNDATSKISEIFSMDLSEFEWNLETVDEEVRKQFGIVYEAAKKSSLVHLFILTCDKLVPYKQNFNTLEKLNPKFITCMAGTEWVPFPFTKLNLKYVFAQADITENNTRFFMTVLFKAFELTHSIWKETVSPDVDVDQFVDVIMNNMDEIQKKAPELSRCKKAFKKIAESVSLLKNNFSEYYRDFVDTKDSTIMMQNFILDVSKQTNSDPEVMREFREIIKYYRKVAGQQTQNPKMKMLFDKVNESFKQLEKGATNLVNIKTSASTTEPTDSDPITAGAMSEEDVVGAQVQNVETTQPAVVAKTKARGKSKKQHRV